jgi:hypothetical protein
VLVLAGGISLAGGVVPAAVGDTTQPTPHASLGAFVCRQAQDPLNRVVGVSATMRPLPGTERMELRFQLLQRLPGDRFHQIRGGDLGRWRHPDPPTFGQQPGDTWIVKKPVANLAAPAVYRFRVTFRWIGSSGVIGDVTRLSAMCNQQ